MSSIGKFTNVEVLYKEYIKIMILYQESEDKYNKLLVEHKELKKKCEKTTEGIDVEKYNELLIKINKWMMGVGEKL